MSKKTAQQRKQDRIKKIVVSIIAFLLVAVLLAGFIVMGVQAVESDSLNITVTDGTNPISGATVTVKEVYDHTKLTQDNVELTRLGGASNKGGSS